MSGVRHMIAVPAVRRSTTQLTLWRLLGYLLLATAVVLGSTLWVFHRVHGAADSVRTRTAPAILGLMVARDALVKADGAAIKSFVKGEVFLAGPGQEYQNQFAIASQSLNQVAESNAAGEVGSRTLQLVEGMLVAYTDLIGQADVHYRQVGGTTLGATDLWYASRLLHDQNGILAQLDTLLRLEWHAFDDQLAASSTTLPVMLVSGGPIVVLLVLLGITQIVLRRRFRRVVNPLLLLATLALAGLCLFMWLVVGSRDRLSESRTTLARVVDDWSAQLTVTDASGKRDMRQLMLDLCGQPPSGCGGPVDRFVADAVRTPPAEPADEGQLARGTRAIEQTAVDEAGSERWIYVLTVLIGGSVLFGLRRRIDEYRYRPT